MDVQVSLAEIRQAVERARSMPMSASAVVNRTELLAMLDSLEQQLQLAFRDCDRVLSDREAVVQEGREEAERLVEEARSERDRLVSDTEVFRVARRRADEVVDESRRESEELRKETDDYVDGKLATFEIALGHTLEAVRRGRERLAGRSALDALAEDDIDSIRLPEYLES